jgi:hypothetical protein
MTLFLQEIGVRADLFFQQYTRPKVLNGIPSLSYGLLRDDFLAYMLCKKKEIKELRVPPQCGNK